MYCLCIIRMYEPIVFKDKGWRKAFVYEITTWNPTENVTQVLLDAVKRIQLCELIDPEHKLTFLSRFMVHLTYVVNKNNLLH